MNAMQPPQSVEEIKAGLETTEKGGVRQSIRNCLTVFQRDPLLSEAIAYNILTDRKDIIKPIGFHRESTALNDTDMKYLLLYLEETYGLTNEKKIDNAIGIVANENKYHPIRDYLSSLVWDGTERIRFCKHRDFHSLYHAGAFGQGERPAARAGSLSDDGGFHRVSCKPLSVGLKMT